MKLNAKKREFVISTQKFAQNKAWILFRVFGIIYRLQGKNVFFYHHKTKLLKEIQLFISDYSIDTDPATYWRELGRIGAQNGYTEFSLHEDVKAALLRYDDVEEKTTIEALEADARYNPEDAPNPTQPTAPNFRPPKTIGLGGQVPPGHSWWWYFNYALWKTLIEQYGIYW